MIPTDQQLLNDYAELGSDSAFAALVERYSGLVFGVALRKMGNRSLV